MRGRYAHRGFTLIEMMVVIGIVALAMGGATVGIRSLLKTDLRVSASRMASSIRYLFDRARVTGKYYRLVFDLDNGRYWAEESDERFYLVRDKERPGKAGRGPADEADGAQQQARAQAAARKRSSDDDSADSSSDLQDLFDANGNLKLGQPKAVFKSFKEANLKPVELKKDVKIADVYTPKQQDAYHEGRAYLYFFPQGFGERAIVHLSDGADSYYSLVVHPLTGRVIVQPGYLEIPRDFDRRDDEGNVAP